jgi:hypothetical protein
VSASPRMTLIMTALFHIIPTAIILFYYISM